jgi:hypothetical protein
VPENLVFAGTPLIEQPLEMVFGEGAVDPNAKITDLVFAQPPRVHPTRLVFGDSDTSTHPDSLFEVSGALPELVVHLHLVIGVPLALQATLPDLVGTVTVKYQSQTQRPTVAHVQSFSQVSVVTESGLTQPQQHALATNAGAQDQAENAASIRQGVSPSYVEAIRSSREVGSQFQDGCATRSRLQANWSDGLADRRVNSTSPFQESHRGPTVRAVGRFQDGLHDRRAWLENSWAGAIPRNKGYTGHAGAAIPLKRFLPSAFEEAWVAMARDVFRQTHDEGVFVADVDHQGRDVGFAQNAKCVHAPFAADQHVFLLPVFAGALGHGNGFFEANGADVFHDLLKHLHVAVAGVEYLYAVNRYQGHRFGSFGGVGQHGGLLGVEGGRGWFMGLLLWLIGWGGNGDW